MKKFWSKSSRCCGITRDAVGDLFQRLVLQ
jgi:hypothetical protein